jgi:hypothetical protein
MIKEAFYKGFGRSLAIPLKKKVRDIALKGMRSLPKDAQDEIVKQNVRVGTGFIGDLLLSAAKPFIGKRRVVKAIKGMQSAGLHADSTAGYYADKVMQKSPLGKKLFRMTEHTKAGPKKLNVVERPSITAPLSKAMGIASPIIVGMEVDKQLKKLEGKKKNEQHQ